MRCYPANLLWFISGEWHTHLWTVPMVFREYCQSLACLQDSGKSCNGSCNLLHHAVILEMSYSSIPTLILPAVGPRLHSEYGSEKVPHLLYQRLIWYLSVAGSGWEASARTRSLENLGIWATSSCQGSWYHHLTHAWMDCGSWPTPLQIQCLHGERERSNPPSAPLQLYTEGQRCKFNTPHVLWPIQTAPGLSNVSHTFGKD